MPRLPGVSQREPRQGEGNTQRGKRALRACRQLSASLRLQRPGPRARDLPRGGVEPPPDGCGRETHLTKYTGHVFPTTSSRTATRDVPRDCYERRTPRSCRGGGRMSPASTIYRCHGGTCLRCNSACEEYSKGHDSQTAARTLLHSNKVGWNIRSVAHEAHRVWSNS